MAKKTKSAWYGVAAVAAGTGIFLLATNQGRLFKKATTGVKSLLGKEPADSATTPTAAPTPPQAQFKGQTPTPENGHVRDVVASNPPPPNSGSNFTAPGGDVHGPKG